MDARELIEFDVEYNLAEVFPDRIHASELMRKCTVCGAASQALPAADLTVIKIRHATQPMGNLRLYCPDHLSQSRGQSGHSSPQGPAGPVCPTCFLAIPSGTLECDACGWTPA